jgi:uncharacterized protein YndB with AHSA1/START domain
MRTTENWADRRQRSAQVAIGAALAIALALAGQARAEVLSAAANGFDARETAHIAAKPERVYAAIVMPSRWWDPAHTYSKSAANLTLDPHAGGCWCETLADGGSVQHLIVAYALPGKALRLRGALGPLQGLGADGAMTWTISPAGDGSDLALGYAVGGYAKDGLDKLAGPVDGVLAEQVGRLKQFIETGSPETMHH